MQSVRPLAVASEGHRAGPIENGHWVDAAQLQPGDRLLNDDGSWTEVVGVEIGKEPLEAFNLTVADFHTYFVSANDNAARSGYIMTVLKMTLLPMAVSS